MTSYENVIDQFSHKETSVIPYTMHFEDALKQKVSKELKTTDWHKAVKNTITVVGHYNTWDTMIRQSDGTMVDAYGSVWNLRDDITHLKKPILSEVSLSDYKFPELKSFCTDVQFDFMRKTLETFSATYPVGKAGAGIYELTWRLMGVEETLIQMITEPKKIYQIFDKLTELIFSAIDDICRLPIEAILIADDWSDQQGVMFGAQRFREMILPYYKEIYAYIHSKGKITISHCCGSVSEIIPDLIDAGLDVLESVQPEAANMNPYQLKKEFGRDLSFWGGLGCQEAVTFFSPEKLRDEIRRLKDEMSVGGGYVLAPSKTLNNSIPVRNALVILEEFNVT
jgi:uroporphyrinogen decarboxylase